MSILKQPQKEEAFMSENRGKNSASKSSAKNSASKSCGKNSARNNAKNSAYTNVQDGRGSYESQNTEDSYGDCK